MEVQAGVLSAHTPHPALAQVTGAYGSSLGGEGSKADCDYY